MISLHHPKLFYSAACLPALLQPPATAAGRGGGWPTDLPPIMPLLPFGPVGPADGLLLPPFDEVDSAATEVPCARWQWKMHSGCFAVESLGVCRHRGRLSDNVVVFADICFIPFSSCLPGGWKHLSLVTTSSAQTCMSRSLMVPRPLL
uniref:Uncharacterized protein n=1 Tax=Oryza punctata TaxID=4537 RepID=A0A0E0JL68_ORYPU